MTDINGKKKEDYKYTWISTVQQTKTIQAFSFINK